MGVYIISDHIQIKLWKKCSVEFFSPAFAKCQTSKMLPTEVNCLIPRKNTLLIFICYQDKTVELCQQKFYSATESLLRTQGISSFLLWKLCTRLLLSMVERIY